MQLHKFLGMKLYATLGVCAVETPEREHFHGAAISFESIFFVYLRNLVGLNDEIKRENRPKWECSQPECFYRADS